MTIVQVETQPGLVLVFRHYNDKWEPLYAIKNGVQTELPSCFQPSYKLVKTLNRVFLGREA